VRGFPGSTTPTLFQEGLVATSPRRAGLCSALQRKRLPAILRVTFYGRTYRAQQQREYLYRVDQSLHTIERGESARALDIIIQVGPESASEQSYHNSNDRVISQGKPEVPIPPHWGDRRVVFQVVDRAL